MAHQLEVWSRRVTNSKFHCRNMALDAENMPTHAQNSSTVSRSLKSIFGTALSFCLEKAQVTKRT